ncbi:hypothetical protein Tco_0957298 [Tanacetum coccineum]
MLNSLRPLQAARGCHAPQISRAGFREEYRNMRVVASGAENWILPYGEVFRCDGLEDDFKKQGWTVYKFEGDALVGGRPINRPKGGRCVEAGCGTEQDASEELSLGSSLSRSFRPCHVLPFSDVCPGADGCCSQLRDLVTGRIIIGLSARYKRHR